MDDPIVVCTETSLAYPLLDMIEFSEHEVDIDEDNWEAQDEVIGVSPNGPWCNLAKTVGNIDLEQWRWR